ncbi:MAG: hypothetical protein J2P23_00315 [Microlunatus sp.]|nr:hypothetical protein [Microlunatus sp.]
MKFRIIFFVIGLIAGVLVVAVEIGALPLAGGGTVGEDQFLAQLAQLPIDASSVDLGSGTKPSGIGIPYLALVDGLLLFVLALQGTSLVLSQRVAAKVQGIATLIVSLIWIIGSLLLALVAVALLLLMVGLLLAVPFGTIVYLAKWGFFPVGASTALLGVVLLLKLIFAAGLLVANQRYLKVKSLVCFFLMSLLLQVVLSFLYGFLPGVVASIGDALWAVVTAIVALVWAVITLIAAIPAIVKAAHSSAEVA